DREAYERGTSVYLPDRVVPMLPRSLSNGICSLNVGEIRLAFSVEMEISPDGTLVNHDIFESVIKVKYKISYDKLYDLLENNSPELKEEYKAHIDDLVMMRKLASVLSAKREAEGSVNFDFPETKVVINEKGETVDIRPYRITFANNIIEEFMLMCNKTVAEEFYWRQIPFLYRVHDKPDTMRITELARVVRNLGYSLKGSAGGDIHPKAFQALLESAKGRPAENLINLLTLRAMQKAKYSSECLGHFGLSMKYYSHFTSPIRRYPDLIIHRIMKSVLRGEYTEDLENFYAENIYDIAEQCSLTERLAFETERDCVDFKCAEYMKQFEGEEFDATISSITGFGIFVVLDNTVEGLIRYTSMHGYFDYDSERMTATHESTGRVLHIGDPIRVILSSVNVVLREIDFVPADERRNKTALKYSKNSRSRSASNKKFRKGKGR
ncbi:MAG: VacB/RNase II family 3'-5' exoribonuclease, partial [Clostridia bacterium]|nr:VacB/RNase II family 3'-5' exoribonuclease [Clostridia bacterium]